LPFALRRPRPSGRLEGLGTRARPDGLRDAVARKRPLLRPNGNVRGKGGLRAILILLLILLTSCRSQPTGGRVIVLGLDGMDPQVVDQLMSEGGMPNFARMRREGAYGRLASSEPLLSPVI